MASSVPGGGWVSFDDDSGPSGFNSAAPTSATASPAQPFLAATPPDPQQTCTPASAAVSLPVSDSAAIPARHAPAPAAATRANGGLMRPPTTAHAGTAPAPASAGWPTATHSFSPLSSSASRPTFPSFAAIHSTAAATGGAPTSAAAAEPTTSGGVHRLPRPPTSTARAPTAASSGAAFSNPFAAHSGATASPGAPLSAAAPTVNPFATSSNAHGAPAAAARSLDPFADFAPRPALPRPPPMAALRAPAPAPTAPGPTASAQQARPPAGAPPAFPTFASLHQQPAPSPASAPWADAGSWPAPVHAPSSPPAAPPPGSALRTMTGSPGVQAGVIQTTSFDAFSSPNKAAQREQQHGFDVQALGAPPRPRSPRAPAPDSHAYGPSPASPRDLPPPPPYEEAVAMSPGLAPPPPPPPPPYDEALTMPHADALAVPPPPPPYADAVAMPTPPAAAATTPAAAAAPDAHSTWASFSESDGASFTSAAASDALASLSLQRAPSQPAPPQPPPLPSQICVEVRLPPLKPKEAAWPKRLAAGLGSAFAAPGGDGVAALQWCLLPGRPGAQGQGQGPEAGLRLDLPPGAGMQQRAPEDWDSAPAVALPLPPSLPDSPVTSMLVDDVSGSLWTGHKDGRVVRWSVGPGRAALYEHHWKAHARGKVTCLALSPWGELWTGSSAGSVRSWQYLGALPASRTPVRLFECRRARLALGPAARATAQRAHSKARLLTLGPSGRVMWSAGRTGLVLWGAYDGEYLGCLTPGQQAAGQEARGGGAYAGDTGAVFRDGGWQAGQQQDEINPQTGLDGSLISRPFVPRAPPDGGDEAEGDPDLGLQVIKGLAGAAKFANKLRKRIQKNLVGEAQGGAGPDGSAASGEPGSGLGAGGAAGKVVALAAGAEQCMYVAYKGGVLEKYTEWGRLLWSREYGRDVRLHSAALVGSLLWLGCGDGSIHTVSAATGEPGRSWKAHDFPVVGLAHGGGDIAAGGGGGGGGAGGGGAGLVYSLSENGSVRAWPAAPPCEAHLVAWRDGLLPCLRRHQLTLLAATWNVNETRPSPQSLRAWLAPRAAGAEIVAVALQEVEMGTSSVARDAALTFLSKAMLERGNQNAQWWAAELAGALASTGHSWVRVALRQMSGLLAVVFCRAELRQHVGEVATASVACGVMGVGGNKGAVALSMSVFRRRVMFLNSHFAAHQERVDERNDNYAKIVRQLHFDNTSKAAQRQKQQQQQQQGGGGVGDANGALDGVGDSDLDGGGAAASTASGAAAIGGGGDASADHDEQGPGVSDAEMLVWAGDFNYRINGFYAEVCQLACAGEYGRLFAADQCRAEMDKGAIFRGLREPLPLGCPIFPPTYKFDKGEPAELVPPAAEAAGRARLRLPYDSSEKQRVPAWTDRVFYRGSRPGSLDVAEEEVQVGVASPHDYNCVLDVNDSDHKPVYAVLHVQLPAYKQDEKRRHSLAAALAAAHQPTADGASPSPHPHHQPLQQPVQASVSAMQLRPHTAAAVDLHNASAHGFHVHVSAQRPPHLAGHAGPHGERSRAPLPAWLEVSPCSFVLLPSHGCDAADSGQSRARVLVRVLGGDGLRPPEPVQLVFSLRPLWGVPTTAGAVGPTLPVSICS